MIGRRWFAVALMFLGVASCTPGGREATEFAGNWRSDTWGSYLSIAGGSAEFFEFTDLHCIAVGGGGVRGIDDVLTRHGDELVLSDAGRVIRFHQVEFLSTDCVIPPGDSAALAFDVAVATIEAHHAPGVDDAWAERVAALRPAPDAAGEALFESLTGLLEPLDHPDVRIASPGRDIWHSVVSPPPALLEGTTSGNGGIVAAEIAPGTAYIGLLRLGGFDDDPARSDRAVADAVDSAAASQVMVLDLRWCDGGSIDTAMLVASRFVPDERLVARLEATGPLGREDAGEIRVRPLQVGTFGGSVYVLVGPGTVGACEMVALALSEVDGVVLVGTTTAGAPGPRMVRQLPNGWAIGLANLSVTSAGGVDLGAGLEPDIESADPVAEVTMLVAAAE